MNAADRARMADYLRELANRLGPETHPLDYRALHAMAEVIDVTPSYLELIEDMRRHGEGIPPAYRGSFLGCSDPHHGDFVPGDCPTCGGGRS